MIALQEEHTCRQGGLALLGNSADVAMHMKAKKAATSILNQKTDTVLKLSVQCKVFLPARSLSSSGLLAILGRTSRMDPHAAAASRPPGRFAPSAGCAASAPATASRSASLANARNMLGSGRAPAAGGVPCGPAPAADAAASMKNTSSPARRTNCAFWVIPLEAHHNPIGRSAFHVPQGGI